MAGPLAAGGTGAVVPGGQSGETAAWAVLHPSSGPADTPAAVSPVAARRFLRVSSGRRAREPGSGDDELLWRQEPLLTPSGPRPPPGEQADTSLACLLAQASKYAC